MYTGKACSSKPLNPGIVVDCHDEHVTARLRKRGVRTQVQKNDHLLQKQNKHKAKTHKGEKHDKYKWNTTKPKHVEDHR